MYLHNMHIFAVGWVYKPISTWRCPLMGNWMRVFYL